MASTNEENLNLVSLDYVFKNLGDAVCVLNSVGELCYTNEAALALFDIPEDEKTKEKLSGFIPFSETNDDLRQLFVDAITEKSVTHHNVVDFEKHDGTTYKLSVSTVYTDETEEKYIVVVITNLTELFKVNEAFKRYTSEEIAEFVLHTPEGEKQGGTSMDVSILMSDLRGFTAMSTKMSPDGLVTVLNHYFAQMSAIIKRYHGTVIEFLGDGIFVVFGAPKPHEAHPADAVRCAIEMQNAMEEVNAWNEENGYPPLSMGIAINSGEAVVGNIGSDARMKYGCMGETVNMAGRIESLSVGGQVLISESTKKRIAGELAIRDVLNFMAKGAKEEIPVYDIAGIGDIRLQSADKEILWQKTESSVPVTFRLLEGKAVVSEPLPGTITKMSEDHSHSILRTETQLKKLTNIVLDIGGDLYGKVTDETEAGYVICFTAKPDSFEAWCQTGGF